MIDYLRLRVCINQNQDYRYTNAGVSISMITGYEDYTDYRLSVCFFKIIHHQICIPLSDITSPTTATSSTIMTRSDVNNILVPFARTDTYKLSFGPHACSLWNSLPSYIKGITSIDTFKNYLISNP